LGKNISAQSFTQWLIEIGKSERTAKSYSGAIGNSLSQIAIDADLIKSNLFQVSDEITLRAVSLNLRRLTIFQQMNERGNSMYSAALNQFATFFSEYKKEQESEDIQAILNDETISPIEKSTLVNARIGQGKFRSQLIDYWKGCAVTGFSDTRLLVASHIKPWHVSTHEERLCKYNGLLLTPNLDKVFDLGYITFSETGKIYLSSTLENYQRLGITADMHVQIQESHQEYMAYHRENWFMP